MAGIQAISKQAAIVRAAIASKSSAKKSGRYIDNPDDIDGLGNFNLDVSDDLSWDDLEGSYNPEIEDIDVSPNLDTVDLSATKAKIKSDVGAYGYLVEDGFKKPSFAENEYGDLVSRVKAGGKTQDFVVQPNGDGWHVLTRNIDFGGRGAPISHFGMTGAEVSDFIRRNAAAIELNRQKFDLLSAVDADTADRLADYWMAAGQNPKALELTMDDEPMIGEKPTQALARIANARAGALGMKASVGQYGGGLQLMLTDKDGDEHMVGLETIKGLKTQAVTVHAAGLTKGSGAGKVIYSIVGSWAAERGILVVADSDGLTAVNAVRRTENGLSAAARGNDAMVPGVAQRVYGYNDKTKSEEDARKNLARLAIAQLRNVLELAPEAADLVYTPETGKFDDEALLAKLIQRPEVRKNSLGRTSFARASITAQLLDGAEMGAGDFAKPVLYSKRVKTGEFSSTMEGHADTDGWLKAPNGQPTNLTPEQWVMARTPSFIAQFGAWEAAAKTGDPTITLAGGLDDNGEPLAVYFDSVDGAIALPDMDGATEALKAAMAVEREWDALRSGPVDDISLEQFTDLTDRSQEAKQAMVDELAKIPDDGFGLMAQTADGRMLTLTPSAQQPGKWQLTRFALNGSPWGDTNYATKQQALREFTEESDLSTLRYGSGDPVAKYSNRQIYSPEFKQWYGDWEAGADNARGLIDRGRAEDVNAVQRRGDVEEDSDLPTGGRKYTFPGTSGPVGADGKPVEFLHGTREEFSVFRLDHPGRKDFGWLGRGVYVTSDPFAAQRYSQVRRGSTGPTIMPLYAAVKNPYFATRELKQKLSRATQESIDRFTQSLKDQGHDGVVMPFEDGHIELVAFNPSDVKSTIGNRGTFDGSNPDIRHSKREDKPVSLPDAVVRHPLGAANGHPDYAAAKSGDLMAAVRMAADLVDSELLDQVRAMGGDVIVPVASIEASGRNKIPTAAAVAIAKGIVVDLETEIVQSNAPKRTSLAGVDRIFSTPEFDGSVRSGARYVIVDDTLTQGATFASLASHIRAGGGDVVGVVALTGKQYSAKLTPSNETLQQLRAKHGDIEQDFRDAVGYGFAALTESEARYIANFKPVESIRDRITAAGVEGRRQAAYGGVSDSAPTKDSQYSKREQALIDRISADGVASPDDLRDLLRIPGFGKRKKSNVMQDPARAQTLRTDLNAAFPGADWRRPLLSEQGLITLHDTWDGLSQESLERLTAIADENDAPVVIRGFGSNVDIEPLGFTPYWGVQQMDGRHFGVKIAHIRPGGGITNTTPLYSKRDDLGYYSELEDKAGESTMKQAPVEAWKTYIKALTQKGVKPDEIEWSGVMDWLDAQSGKVKKEDLVAYLEQGGVKVQEIVLGSRAEFNIEVVEDGRDSKYPFAIMVNGVEENRLTDLDAAEEEAESLRNDPQLRRQYRIGDDQTKYGKYTLSGGENYREVLLTLPEKSRLEKEALHDEVDREYRRNGNSDRYAELMAQLKTVTNSLKQSSYKSSHWDQKNVVAHIRINDRTDASGDRVMFVEEVQSDWGQDGKKKGFDDPNKKPVTRKDFEDYADRLLDDYVKQQVQAGESQQEASRRGINMNPAQLAQELDRSEEYARMREGREKDMLGKVGIPAAPFVTKTDGWLNLALKRIVTMAVEGGYEKVAFVNGEQSADRYDLSKSVYEIAYNKQSQFLRVIGTNGNTIFNGTKPQDELEDFVGKEIAEKIVSGGNFTQLKDLDLKVGGEGMKTFYDSIVPMAVKKLISKMDGRLEEVSVLSDPNKELDLWEPEDGIGDGSRAEVQTLNQLGFTITKKMHDSVVRGLPRFSRRVAMEAYMDGRNKSMPTISPASVLDADIALAVKAIDAASREIISGNRETIPIPLGRTPHALNMVGAPQKMLHIEVSILRKVLFDKHSEDFADVNAETFVRALYQPAMILKGRSAKEFEIVTGIVTKNGPIIVPVTDVGKSYAVMSAYAKNVGGPGDSLMRRIKSGALLYADPELAQVAVTGRSPIRGIDARGAQFPDAPPRLANDANVADWDTAVKPLNMKYVGWAQLRGEILTGISGGKVKTDLDVIGRIGKLYKGDIVDAPSYSRRSGTSNWDEPLPSKWDDYAYKLQDKLIDLKRVIQDITKWTGALADDINVYLQEELFHGRTAKRVQEFARMELNPALKALSDSGMQLSDLEEYLHARHAKEANRVIAARNPNEPGLQDGGSGMTDAEADAYFASLSAADAQKLGAVAAMMDGIMERTNKLMVEYGLESQDTVDGWGRMFQHYVPLHREDKGGGAGLGQGFSVKGKETKGRTGSRRKVVDIVSHIAMAREKTVVRGEKNRVAVSLVGLATAHPNQDFWKVGPPEMDRVFNPKTGLVEERVNPMYKNQPNVVVAKVLVNGKPEEVAVVFNEDNERAVRLAGALKNLDSAQLEGLMGVSAKITRYFASVNTQYNPVFGIINLVRDLQGAMLNLGTTPLAGMKGRISRDAVVALAHIYRDIRATRNGGVASSPWSQLYEQFQEDGGQTGFRDLFQTPADRTSEMNDMIDPEAWARTKLGRFFTADGALVKPMNEIKRGTSFVFDWLSDYNEAMENGVRLAAYKAALDNGMSRQKAASIAKNLTVNFNRKGQSGTQAGAVYAFFNAAMQGSARLAETLVTMEPGKPSTVRLSPLGKKIVYGGMLLGSIQAMALAAAGFGEDEPPAFVRERSVVVPLGGGNYFSIPMPLGFHVIPSFGRIVTEFALGGFEKPQQRAAELIGLFADAFNPIGNAGLSMQTLAPTAIDPLVALTENKDWTGRPIAKMSFNRDEPGFANHKDTATWISKVLAEGINNLSGGNKYVAGVLSPTPDQIDYLAAQLGGGVWRELSKIEQTAVSSVTGEELPIYKVPLVGRFIGTTGGKAGEAGQFYANASKLNRLETEIKGLEEDGLRTQANELRRKPQAYLIAQMNAAERELSKLRRQKSEMLEKSAPRESVVAIEQRITAVMARMNRAMEARAD